MDLDDDELRATRGIRAKEYNYYVEFWYKDYVLTQNLGYSKMSGNYNGYTISKVNEKGEEDEILHAQARGQFTVEEMIKKLDELPKLLEILKDVQDKEEKDN